MLEGDWQTSLRVQPTVGYNGDVVVGRDGLEHRDSEGDVVLILRIPLTENERVVEKDDLSIDILDQDPE